MTDNFKSILEIGPTPCHEPCAQVGSDDYATRARAECKQFITAIRRELGSEPDGARLFVRANPHDYGTYYEVAVRFTDSDPVALEYTYKVEAKAPADWSDEDKQALGISGEE